MVAIASHPHPALAGVPARPAVRLVAVPHRTGVLAADSPLLAHRAVIAWALGTLVAVAALALLVLSPALATTGTGPAPTHVVAAGETMWSIAAEVAPAGEAAGYVERLVSVNGGAQVVPGQVLVLPTP